MNGVCDHLDAVGYASPIRSVSFFLAVAGGHALPKGKNLGWPPGKAKAIRVGSFFSGSPMFVLGVGGA